MRYSSNTIEPMNGAERLLEITELDLFSPEVDAILQNTVEEAAKRFDLPIGLVSIGLDEPLAGAPQVPGGWLRDAAGTSVELLCTTSAWGRDSLVVEDATQHELVKDSAFVKFEGVRCIAGTPLVSSRGHVLGSFCVLGTQIRSFAEEELAELREYAAHAVTRIEARRRQPLSTR
jgi:GAF domain-containing protein